MWIQKQIRLSAKSRGFHLITAEVVKHLPELKLLETGLAHFFLRHTSASLSINENADASVRRDMEAHFNVLAPEDAPYYEHIYEGADDMPAHIKASLIGCEVTVPVQSGHLVLGTWQGLYLGEHRNHGGARQLTVTLTGQSTGGAPEHGAG